MSHLAESSDSQLKLGKAVLEFDSYIRANTDRIPNCGERRRAGETISTSFVESTVNQVVSKRMVKKQQMRWSPQGTHLFLQVGERDKLGEARGGRRLARAAAGIPASPTLLIDKHCLRDLPQFVPLSRTQQDKEPRRNASDNSIVGGTVTVVSSRLRVLRRV
jgi:hypothetical protein